MRERAVRIAALAGEGIMGGLYTRSAELQLRVRTLG
jgi:hypothetical protein